MNQAKELAILESRCGEASSQIEDDLLKLRHSIHVLNKCAKLGRYHLKCRNAYSVQFGDSEFRRKYDYDSGKVKHIVLNVENFLRRAQIRSALMRRRRPIQVHSMQLRSADRCLRSNRTRPLNWFSLNKKNFVTGGNGLDCNPWPPPVNNKLRFGVFPNPLQNGLALADCQMIHWVFRKRCPCLMQFEIFSATSSLNSNS